MEIYLDLVVLLNFLVDYLLLLGTNRLAGFPPGRARCGLAAALGALYSGCCLLPGFAFLGNLLWRSVFLCLMAAVAFGGGSSMGKRSALFLLLSMALGGIAISLGRGDFPALVLAAVLIWLLCRISFGNPVGSQSYVPVTLTYNGKTAGVLALQDTGNTLRDPITGEQVLIISSAIAQRLTGLPPEALKTPLETLAKHTIPGLRLIPYRAVGQGSGMLLGLKLDHVKIGSREQSAIVAFAPEGLEEGSMYQALAGGAL